MEDRNREGCHARMEVGAYGKSDLGCGELHQGSLFPRQPRHAWETSLKNKRECKKVDLTPDSGDRSEIEPENENGHIDRVFKNRKFFVTRATLPQLLFGCARIPQLTDQPFKIDDAEFRRTVKVIALEPIETLT